MPFLEDMQLDIYSPACGKVSYHGQSPTEAVQRLIGSHHKLFDFRSCTIGAILTAGRVVSGCHELGTKKSLGTIWTAPSCPTHLHLVAVKPQKLRALQTTGQTAGDPRPYTAILKTTIWSCYAAENWTMGRRYSEFTVDTATAIIITVCGVKLVGPQRRQSTFDGCMQCHRMSTCKSNAYAYTVKHSSDAIYIHQPRHCSYASTSWLASPSHCYPHMESYWCTTSL